MNTIEAFWFVFWRMTLWGLCLLAAVGTVYGLLVGGLTFPYGIGFMLTGPIFATASGLCIGPLEGAVLEGCPCSTVAGAASATLTDTGERRGWPAPQYVS